MEAPIRALALDCPPANAGGERAGRKVAMSVLKLQCICEFTSFQYFWTISGLKTGCMAWIPLTSHEILVSLY